MAARSSELLSLGSLPVEVICDDILPHLSIRDLQALDTAFTNKLQRPQVRNLWKSYQWKRLEVVLSHDELMSLHELGVCIVEVHTDHCEQNEAFNSVVKFELGNTFSLNCVDSTLLILGNQCPQLEWLTLPFCPYSDIGVTALAQKCHQLRSISLRSKSITDASIQALCDNCPQLQHIGIPVCTRLTDASLMSIASTYPHLQSIHMTDCQFTDDALIFFADKCHELRSVTVSGDRITSRGLAALWAANPNITEFESIRSHSLSLNEIMPLVQCCSNLQCVNIDGCEHIMDQVVIAVAEHCPNLMLLSIGGCTNITDAAVIAVAEHCPQLNSLVMCSCRSIGDDVLIALGQHCHELKSIDMSSLRKVTDAGISALAAGCPLIQVFTAWSSEITDAGMIALAERCHDLRKIGLDRCKFIGLKSASAIAKNCPLISELVLSRCNVDDACLYVIAEHCRNLTVLDIILGSDGENYSDAAIQAIFTSCRLLYNCFVTEDIIGDETMEYLHRRYPDVLIEV